MWVVAEPPKMIQVLEVELEGGFAALLRVSILLCQVKGAS
jgi:hypothetical protein